MRIVIQLEGSAKAAFGEAYYIAPGNRHDPVRPLVRRLLAESVIDAEDLITVARGDVACFKPRRAKQWAAFDTVDTDDGLVTRPAYIGPHAPGAVKVASRLGRPAPKARFRPMGAPVQPEASA